MHLEFLGAAQTVTGSKHLVRTPDATVLLNCGLFQGRRREARQRNQQLGVEPAEIDAAVQALPQALLQFHGDETPAACEAPGRPYLRAARMASGFDLVDFARQFSSAQAILLDAHVEGYGGGGKVFDWSLIPANVSRAVVLSGGLHAGNVIAGILGRTPLQAHRSIG